MTRRHSAGFAVVASLVVGMGISLSAVIGAPAAAATTAGCGKTATLTSGQNSIQTSGKRRNYILRLPDGYDGNRPYRLVFGFHWRGGTANDVDSGGTSGYPWSYYGLRALSSNSAIFVAPQGFDNGWANAGGQDVTFVDDMIRQIEADLCVDTTQVFAAGFSYGAGMSYALACTRATVFRAVAVYAGGQLSGCAGGTRPVAYIGLHGLRDPVLNISLGRSLRDTFVKANGCTPQSPPEPAQGSLTHVVTTYSGCRPGYPVVWAAFDAGHTPNPMDGSASDFSPGERSWTRTVVWNFFAQFRSAPARPAASGSAPASKSASASASASARPSVSASATEPPTPADTPASVEAAPLSGNLAANDVAGGAGRPVAIAAGLALLAGAGAMIAAIIVRRRRSARYGNGTPPTVQLGG